MAMSRLEYMSREISFVESVFCVSCSCLLIYQAVLYVRRILLELCRILEQLCRRCRYAVQGFLAEAPAVCGERIQNGGYVGKRLHGNRHELSASLISSLGGDTEKAVEYADMAITDMSDNANKMGTDMASIQNAYQGFAKQNYTMLDNLKLGYGGTKQEMERLLADAQAISGSNTTSIRMRMWSKPSM